MVPLKLIDIWWPPSFDDLIIVSLDQMIVLLFAALILGLSLHLFSPKEGLEDNVDSKEFETKNYPLFIKITSLFIILAVICIPIFKLLGTSYFL
ncbi:hypothetical protein [Tenacibaculum amylolyticum]|uniref:hypothetical protein n=1 Tax=Tenacibaculum amylolyticum TaxID=104269 RepID=UPI0038942D83